MKILNDHILPLYLKLREIPFLLRLFTIAFCIMGPVAIIGLFLPYGSYSINDVKVTLQEFWTSGYALQWLVVGILMTISGVGLYYRKAWSRHLCFVVFVLVGLFALYNDRAKVDASLIIVLAINYMIIIYYFYLRGNVQEYFKSNLRTDNTYKASGCQ